MLKAALAIAGTMAVLTLVGGAAAQTVADVSPPEAAGVPSDPTTFSEDPIARFSARIAYNSDLGPVVGAGFSTDRLFGNDQTLSFNVEAMEDGTRLNFLYDNEALFGRSPSFGLRVLRADNRAGSVYGFDSTVTRIEPRLTWALSPGLRAAAFASYAYNEIDNVPAGSSALIIADRGDQEAWAVGGDLAYRFRAEGGGALRSAGVDLSASYGRTTRDHEFLRVTARAQAVHAFDGGNIVLRSQLRAGTVGTLSGISSIGDRFMLGQASIRGFAFGGFGPRDLAAPGRPALGGNSYGIGRFDAQFPNAFGAAAERFVPGVFLDAGSLWDLDSIAGGPGGLSPVDDSASLRASMGLTLRIGTGIGPIQIFVAHPIAEESYDRTQAFGLVYSHRF